MDTPTLDQIAQDCAREEATLAWYDYFTMLWCLSQGHAGGERPPITDDELDRVLTRHLEALGMLPLQGA